MGNSKNDTLVCRPVFLNNEPSVLIEMTDGAGTTQTVALAPRATELLIGKLTVALARLMVPPQEEEPPSSPAHGMGSTP